MTTADRLAAVVDRVTPVYERVAFPDTCEVIRSTSPGKDDYGNDLPPTAPSVVSSGRCVLRAGGLQPNERVTADRLGWAVPYVIEMSKNRNVRNNDRIRVANQNREFEVGGVVKEGGFGFGATVVVDERG